MISTNTAIRLIRTHKLIVGPKFKSGGPPNRFIGWSVYGDWLAVADDIGTMPGDQRELAFGQNVEDAVEKAVIRLRKRKNGA